ncbi:MAG: hypothetical protein JGK12_02570 [Microcoleus sp. PH2017_01_SCD_O_A]|uniref:hypothetical protein n=1 Tax=unclassified Microcoleus TaxID=2642155 RepID=UPI001DD44386|nr:MULTISPECIES: hypothetical protein [unclassified Microcoleus]MCC3468124.1 hypothetical protein [Microcoleus sp. PH2017_06_SFM_O_A]TAE52527.1 MAG: hypothetical protein EAZ88_14915 [Oscillatoriales cyanobacterium]MCC3422820.1 hypothetical protein [Microcoleus sp. PH2017_01_SCD_O_A]MCC3496473.1 hypothetical protein [Microcoleus sp. PH2017_15_JOR_U_A]MCC3516644.1 hypothetical protein [Microcoleus sp. PH2017_18_LLB_O_A]
MLTPHTIQQSEEVNAQLDIAERARLQQLESIVEQGLHTFYEVGKALEEIREQKLYRETHKNFEAYCHEKWGITKRRAYQFIDAAEIMENLCTNVHNSLVKEYQIRPLKGLPPEVQLEIWQEAVESSPNGIPTGAAVQRLVEQRFPSLGSGRTPKDTASELEKLRSDNQRLRQQIREQNRERDRRAAAVALEMEQLRAENRQLKAELRQRDKDWEVRLAAERVKIRAEVIAELREEIRAEVKAEYEGQINSLTQQLAEMTANYHAVLARLTALEAKGK